MSGVRGAFFHRLRPLARVRLSPTSKIYVLKSSAEVLSRQFVMGHSIPGKRPKGVARHKPDARALKRKRDEDDHEKIAQAVDELVKLIMQGICSEKATDSFAGPQRRVQTLCGLAVITNYNFGLRSITFQSTHRYSIESTTSCAQGP